jgi:hypothetical protein
LLARADCHEDSGMSALAKLVGFLRAGYPEAAPPTGYVPLLALLRRRLSDDEVSAVATHLAASGDVSVDGIDIGTAITRITHELPAADDIDRIRQRLNSRNIC